MALLSYYVICTYISPLGDALIDEAVLPPQKGDVSPHSEESTYESMDVVQTMTKEVSDVV